MDRRHPSGRSLAEAAALARIAELSTRGRSSAMETPQVHPSSPARNAADSDPKPSTRAMWALGDYHRFARKTVWPLGPVLVEACGVGPGQRLLDVAAGTGNVAIRAAAAGADVVACDLTPENFQAGRREAARHGVELEWVEGDAESLPFEDDGFDVVTSCFGALFAPDQEAVARELVRVCRPGGTIGMVNFRPTGVARAFFELVGRWAPAPPPGTRPPTLWGEEDHVRELFGQGVAELEMTRGSYVERSPDGPQGYVELFRTTFGPTIALRESVAGDPVRRERFDRDFLDFATRWNEGPADGPAEYTYEYLLVVARA